MVAVIPVCYWTDIMLLLLGDIIQYLLLLGDIIQYLLLLGDIIQYWQGSWCRAAWTQYLE